MTPELVTAAVLVGPAAVIGSVCLAGHLWTRRYDAAMAAACAAFRTEPAPQPSPTGPGESASAPVPAQENSATVIDFPGRRRYAA